MQEKDFKVFESPVRGEILVANGVDKERESLRDGI